MLQEDTRRGTARRVGSLLLLSLGIVACLLGTPWGLLVLLGLAIWALNLEGRPR